MSSIRESPKTCFSRSRISLSSRRPKRATSKRSSLGATACSSARVLRLPVNSLVHSWAVIRAAVSPLCPLAMSPAKMDPALQPTTMSRPMPSRVRTFWMPIAAAHLTLPDPITSATRARFVFICVGTSLRRCAT